MKYLLFFVFFAVSFSLALAQVPTGIVPCDGAIGIGGDASRVCQGCHLVQLGQNIITWLVGIIVVVGAIIFAIAGLKMASSGGNSGKVSEAKGMMTNVVVGLFILLAGWLIIDTVMKMFVDETTATGIGPWNVIQCVTQPTPAADCSTSDNPPACTCEANGGIWNLNDGTCDMTGVPPTTPECEDDAALMARYNGSPVGLEAIGLQSMIACYLSEPLIAQAVDSGQIYTVDRSHPRCSLTNGNTVCGPCSHSQNSCHYGRGSQLGARAVDFNARDNSLAGEQALFNLIRARQSSCPGTPTFESTGGAIHTHINLPGC